MNYLKPSSLGHRSRERQDFLEFLQEGFKFSDHLNSNLNPASGEILHFTRYKAERKKRKKKKKRNSISLRETWKTYNFTAQAEQNCQLVK